MQIVGFYCRKDIRAFKDKRVKEINIDVDKVALQVAMTIVMVNGMTKVAYAGPLTKGVQPIIDLLKDLAEPVAYAFMVKGFLKIMSGDEQKGKKSIKYAIGGYIGVQWIPYIFQIIKGIKF